MVHGNWKDLFLGVENNDLDLVQAHIRNGVDINYQHPEFLTSPLIESIRRRNAEMTAILLQNGASPTICEVETAKSPQTIAYELKNFEAIKILNQYLASEEQNFPNAIHSYLSDNQTMKAAICTKYGSPEVLQIVLVEKPIPKDNEILVKIRATAVNSGDVRVRALAIEGFMKIVMRLVLGFTKPRKPILGTVFSGIIEQTGSKVATFKVGDEVFGITGFNFGTYAEYISVEENSNVILKPKNATFEEAAAIPFGGQTAIYFLKKAKIMDKKNSKILIIGATGSVGTAAIQIAQYYNATITAVCSSSGVELIKKLGVSDIILYDKEDFTKKLVKYDIIFDAVGKTNKKQCLHLLNEGGVFKTVGGLDYASETREQLELIKELFEKGVYKALIDRAYSLEQVVNAHSYVDTSRKKGNVVLKIGA